MRTQGNEEINSSPAIWDGLLFVGSNDGNIYCLDALTGKKIWNYNTGGIISDSSPAVAYGYVYVGSMDGNVYAFNALTGEKIWNYTTYCSYSGYGVESSPAVAGGVVYVGSDDGNLYAFNASTGTKLWDYRVQSEFNKFGHPQHMPSSPAIANGRIYIGSLDHVVIVLGTPYQATSTPATIQLPNQVFEFALVISIIIFVIIGILAILSNKRKKAKQFNL